MVQTAVDISILSRLISEAVLLIIMSGSDAHAAFLHFTADSGHMTVFIAIEVLGNPTVPIKELISLKLIVKD